MRMLRRDEPRLTYLVNNQRRISDERCYVAVNRMTQRFDLILKGIVVIMDHSCVTTLPSAMKEGIVEK